MRKINEFFFPLEEGEELCTSDFAWFYGTLGAAILVTVGLVLITS